MLQEDRAVRGWMGWVAKGLLKCLCPEADLVLRDGWKLLGSAHTYFWPSEEFLPSPLTGAFSKPFPLSGIWASLTSPGLLGGIDLLPPFWVAAQGYSSVLRTFQRNPCTFIQNLSTNTATQTSFCFELPKVRLKKRLDYSPKMPLNYLWKLNKE